jgi:hypothetical protein
MAATAPPLSARLRDTAAVPIPETESEPLIEAAAAAAFPTEAPADPAGGYSTEVRPDPAGDYAAAVPDQPAGEYSPDGPAQSATGYLPEARSESTFSHPPLPAEPDVVDHLAAQADDAVAPTAAAALAPVVAPVVVPTEPGSLSRRSAGLIEPVETQASLDARPEATQLGPSPVPRPPATIRRSSRVRKARLRLMRVDPWSVMKTAFLLSVALGITLFVAIAVLWSVLDAAGVFTAVSNLVADLTTAEGNPDSAFRLENYTALSRVLGFTTLIAVIDVVLVTALATLGAFLYNLSASLLGGLEVTLAEDD